MKFRVNGVHDPNALEILREVHPLEFAKRSPLNRLNFLLRLIQKYIPESFDPYVTNLQQRYESLINSNLVEERAIDTTSLVAEYDILKAYPTLVSSNLNYFLHELQPPPSTDWSNERVEVSQRNQLRAFLCPKYQNILVLTETIDRKDAIELYKMYHDEFMRYVKTQQGRQFETLEDMAKQWNQEEAKQNPGLIRIISDVEDGKLFLRKDTCVWNDAIADLDDVELKYYICCYGDFESARLLNKHFVMTMEHTIVEGHPYCDCVFHDTRINSDLSHPSDEFFASITPE